MRLKNQTSLNDAKTHCQASSVNARTLPGTETEARPLNPLPASYLSIVVSVVLNRFLAAAFTLHSALGFPSTIYSRLKQIEALFQIRSGAGPHPN